MSALRLAAATLVLTGLLLPAARAAGPVSESVAAQAAEMRQLIDASATRRRPSDLADDDPGATLVLPAGARVERDVAYGSTAEQKLDAYIPAGASNAPVVVLVHGGAWLMGDKTSAGLLANKVARWLPRGYILASVNYRLVPRATPLDQADDLARALALVQQRAAGWGGNPQRVLLMGHSAGAHLAGLLVADPAIAGARGASRWLGTVLLDSAAMDVPALMQAPHQAFYDTVFKADKAVWQQSSPLHRLQAAPAAPALLVCSSQRDLSCAQNKAFATKASGFGGRVSVLPVAMSHREINQDLGLAGEYTEAVEAFMKALGLP
jgi:acetyl esterase/lipase